MSAVAELVDSALDTTTMIYSVKVLANEGDAAGGKDPAPPPHGPW